MPSPPALIATVQSATPKVDTVHSNANSNQLLLLNVVALSVVLIGLRAALGGREGNVWFAGEAVHDNSLLASSVRGAWQSGVTAAADICVQMDIPVRIPNNFPL
jgi:hypothetical protein